MSKIKNVIGREILDSRGMPTVEVEVITESGAKGVFGVPSGASTGTMEALELRDNDERYGGKGVLTAVNNVNTVIRENIVGMEVSNQKTLDEALITLDGTENKSSLGANAILGVSIASLKAAAMENNEELYKYLNKRDVTIPYPMINIVNGGKHAPNNLDIQEFMIVPKFLKFSDAIKAASEIFQALKTLLLEKDLVVSVGDEGGFAPDLENNKSALSYIVKAINIAGYLPGKNVFLALDVAASSFYNEKSDTYNIDKKNMTREELLDYYIELCKEYPIISIEDPFNETDYEGFKLITKALGNEISIVGDDLFVTNKKLLEYGVNNGLCNAILIKPNQIGTFYEMLETIAFAKQNKYTCIMSHRSGETTDTFIADASVALNTPFIKTGSVCRGERICKYNRLLKIEEDIKK